MTGFSFVFYILALSIGFLTVYLAYRMNKAYRWGFLSSYLYFLISFNVMGFLNHVGRHLGVRLLRGSPEETLMLVRYLFAFLAFPFVALSIYLFFMFANDLLEQKISSMFNRLFGAAWSLLFIIQVFLAKNYFDTKDEKVLFSFFIAINFIGIISFLLIPFYIFFKTRKLADYRQKKVARHFSLIYLICFGTSSLITSRLILPYFIPYTVSLMVFSFFVVNLPPLLYLFFSLQKLSLDSEHSATQESDLRDFCIVHKISKREQEIIELMLRGMSNADIENTLFISPHTVKNHIYNIYQKLGVKNRVQVSNLIRDRQQIYKTD
jgi:DNA-binding CsgD family transcriptional regulator